MKSGRVSRIKGSNPNLSFRPFFRAGRSECDIDSCYKILIFYIYSCGRMSEYNHEKYKKKKQLWRD